MPPKPKGKDKGKGKDKKEPKDEGPEMDPPAPTEKEYTVKKELVNFMSELDRVTEDVANLRVQLKELQDENEWLLAEAERTQAETHEYQGYMAKKAQKRHSLIVSLTDENHRQLAEIERQRGEVEREFEERKAELKATLSEQEAELAKVKRELKELEQYKALQQQQDLEMARLERTLEEMHFQHENSLRAMRAKFLQERQRFEEEHKIRTAAVTNLATQADVCVKQHSQQIIEENKSLRAKLHGLIEATQGLQAQKKRLERQHQALLRERELQEDLKKLRLKRAGVVS